MRKYKKINNKLSIAVKKAQDISNEIYLDMNNFDNVNKNMIKNYEKIDELFSDIDTEFAKTTSITNTKDQIFLWTAVALQTARWVLLPAFKIDDIIPDYSDRESAGVESSKENKNNSDWYNENRDKDVKEDEFISWKEYFENPVPYDALNGEGARNMEIKGVTPKGKNLGSKNHHSATLGHDPVLGYIFGTVNIMTRTITFNKYLLPTNKVNLIGKKEQEIMELVSFIEIFIKSIEAEISDKFRIPAAVARQALHIESDKMSMTGLPIPFLSASKQQELLMKGWNSKELDRMVDSFKKNLKGNMGIIGAQFLIALFINMVIKTLHILMFDEEKDVSFDSYNVRTHKILEVSNIIGSLLNISYVSGSVTVGVLSNAPEIAKQGLMKIDLGGYIETVHRIVSSRKLQEQIRREYLEKQLYKKFLGKDFYF